MRVRDGASACRLVADGAPVWRSAAEACSSSAQQQRRTRVALCSRGALVALCSLALPTPRDDPPSAQPPPPPRTQAGQSQSRHRRHNRRGRPGRSCRRGEHPETSHHEGQRRRGSHHARRRHLVGGGGGGGEMGCGWEWCEGGSKSAAREDKGLSAAGTPHSRLGEARRAVTQALGRGKSVCGARSTHARHYAPLGAPRKLMMEVDKGAAVKGAGRGMGDWEGYLGMSPRLHSRHLRMHASPQ